MEFLFYVLPSNGCIFFLSILVTELCEYAANVDIPIARESIRAVGKIALQQYDVNAIVDRLLQFLEMEKDYVTAEALVSSTFFLPQTMDIQSMHNGHSHLPNLHSSSFAMIFICYHSDIRLELFSAGACKRFA